MKKTNSKGSIHSNSSGIKRTDSLQRIASVSSAQHAAAIASQPQEIPTSHASSPESITSKGGSPDGYDAISTHTSPDDSRPLLQTLHPTGQPVSPTSPESSYTTTSAGASTSGPASGLSRLSKCAIFWDFENCAPPAAVPGYVVVENIRRAITQFGPIVAFRAYFEINETSRKNMRTELQSSGVSIIDTPHNSRKDAADKMILVDMLAFAMDFQPPATIVLISGDRDFVYGLATLRNRRYNIVLIVPNKGATPVLRSQANVLLEWRYDILSTDVVSKFQKDRDDAAQRVSVLQKSTSQLLAAGGSFDALVQGNQSTMQQQPIPSTIPNSYRSAALMGSSSSLRIDVVGKELDAIRVQDAEPDDSIPVYSPQAPGFFDILMEILNNAKLSGVSKPSKSKVCAELLSRNPMLCQRVGVQSVNDFLETAVAAGLIRIGGVGSGAWITSTLDK
eukprot:jgi/Hompol1/4928/HPOL_004032-RA